MIEDLLARKGLLPDIDDRQLAAVYERLGSVEKSLVKNAVSFAYALAQNGVEPVSQSRRCAHVQETRSTTRLDWALFTMDVRRFSVGALFSAVVLALVARVENVLLHVSGPVIDALLFGCDLLSVDQIFTADPRLLVEALREAGPGVCLDLAGLDLGLPRVICPDPADYGLAVRLKKSVPLTAYAAMNALTKPQTPAYLVYGGKAGAAPVVMTEDFLGCFVWDILDVDSFRHCSLSFS